jgi:hypothetical protein
VTTRRLVRIPGVEAFTGSYIVLGGTAVLGEAFSMAAAYALERVLKAVGELVSTFAMTAVDVDTRVSGAGEARVLSDSLGLLGGDDMIVDCS